MVPVRGKKNSQKISIRMMWISLLLLVAVMFLATIMYQCNRSSCSFDGHPSKKTYVFGAQMRSLWEEHIEWTRNLIISDIAGLADTTDVVARLLKNQEDIGNAIIPFFGATVGAQLTELLKQHILIAVDVIKAAKLNDAIQLENISKKWYENADNIASFISANLTRLSKEEQRIVQDSLIEMMHKHLQYTTGEVVSRLKQDWKSDIEFYDKGHAHMLMFSDMLVKIIYNQFPKNFK